MTVEPVPAYEVGVGRHDDPPGQGVAETVRSEERLVPAVVRVPAERVRIGRRIVTETRTVEVQVRREELYLEHVPLGTADAGIGTGVSPAAAVELVLHEEVPQLTSVGVRPVERVRVSIVQVAGEQVLEASLRREQVMVERVEPDAAGA